MMIDYNPKFCYNDISIAPSVISDIEHRSECNPYLYNGNLPIFTAPMSTVVSEDNFKLFEDNNIIPILPRTASIGNRLSYLKNGKWVAFSLSEFEVIFCDKDNKEICTDNRKYALIDIANGHMRKLYTIVKRAKFIHGDSLRVMVGNIANPETYRECVKANVDYVRCSIGCGSGCITSTQTSINYPIASLIDEIQAIRLEYITKGFVPSCRLPQIIADGGIRNYSDVIKALALGADYVMIGGLFSELVESSGKIFYFNYGRANFDNEKTYLNPFVDKIEKTENGFLVNGEEFTDSLYKEFYGMASKEGQIDLNGAKSRTSEGKFEIRLCTTNLNKWSENMASYMRSAMSYLGMENVRELKNAHVILISNNSRESINS